jgi:polysaccharide export outer membrane protein
MQNMYRTRHTALILCSLLGCHDTAQQASAQTSISAVQSRSHSDSTKAESVRGNTASYRLTSNDTVLIQVFQEDELTNTARIGKDGTIAFPLIGTIQIGGHSVSEATSILTQALREYLLHPQVSIRIVDYSKKRFTVLGQVNRPGTFDLPDENPLNLLEGIGLAGGYSRIANPSKVTVKRQTPGGDQVFHLDAKQMAKSNKAPSFQIQAGDTVIVAESLF